MKKNVMCVFLIVGALAGSAKSLNFKQVAYIPSGIIWGYGYIKGLDLNHDGVQDLMFSTVISSRVRILYYSCFPYNRYVFEDSTGPASDFWDVGNLDGDSLIDIVAQREDSSPSGIFVFEPADYWSFPDIRVWSWRYEYIGNGVQAMYITDLDRDGLKEILTADAQVIYVFENRGNNQYVKVFSDTVKSNLPTPSFAIGDFDGSGQMQFAFGTYGGAPLRPTVFVYKCTGPDQYQMVWNDTLNAWNMYDCITGPDLDGDGKQEFIIGDFHNGAPHTAGLWIYGATGINQYAVIYKDSVTGLNDRGGYSVHSDCGDLLRDGKPELVWAIDRDWMVYKYDSLGHRFQRVFRAYGDNGHNSTNVHIHDMNGNGYPEIIESGGNETHIWEVEACQVVYPNGGETLYWDSSCVVRWRNVTPFVADSFSLFFSTDSSRTYSPIANGIPGSDSTYTWTVPDTLSDTCFIMLWAYQNATGWDFSDGPFRIRRPDGVEVPSVIPLSPCLLVPLSVVPNPFVFFSTVPGHEKESFALYDVSGRLVGTFKGDKIGAGLSAGIYFLKSEENDSKPLRIVKLR